MKYIKCKAVITAVLSLGLTAGVHAGHEGHGHAEGGHGEVAMSKPSQDLMAVKTSKAVLEPFGRKISVVGQIAQDADCTVNVAAPGSGEIVGCAAWMGSVVKKDDVLCTVKLYSDGSTVEVRSPISGVVIGGSAKSGERVDTVSMMHTIADFSVLQATFDVYEKDIRFIRLGQDICAKSAAYPDKCFDGRIKFISPRVDAQTNSIKVRADIDNPENLLKLGMFVAADISVVSDARYVVLPLEAVHRSGDRMMVFVKTGPENFVARDVTVAEQSGGMAAISCGLSEGDEIVTGNGFLLKSELFKSKMGDGCAD